MYYDRRGTDKNHPEQILPDKNLGQNLSQTKTNLHVKTYVPVHVCMRALVLLKIGGPRCVTYLRGSRDVWKSVTGEGGQNWFKIAWHALWTATQLALFCLSSKGGSRWSQVRIPYA